MPAPEHLHPILAALGDGATVDLAERVHRLMEDARAEERSSTPRDVRDEQRAHQITQRLLQHTKADLDRIHDGADSAPTPAGSSPSVGQLWHQLLTAPRPDRDALLGRLLKATEPTHLTATMHTSEADATVTLDHDSTGPDIHDLIERSSLGEPDAKAARERVPLEEAQSVVARAMNTPPAEDEIDWDDNPEDEAPRAEPTAAEVRAWCVEHDVPVNAKGAIRADARAAYDTAHQEA